MLDERHAMTTRFNSANDAIDDLYGDLATANLQPLWELHGLLTNEPHPRTKPFRWRAADMHKLATRSGELIPIDEGGDRRVLAMSNPGLDGAPYISTTMWAAVQYLLPGETAPQHRHSPAALRFILDGDGVSTTVNRDSIPMARGDLVLTPSWTWHGHHNQGLSSMMWLDILDLPVVEALEAIFFEPGPPPYEPSNRSPSAPEQLYGQSPGLLPAGRQTAVGQTRPLAVDRVPVGRHRPRVTRLARPQSSGHGVRALHRSDHRWRCHADVEM